MELNILFLSRIQNSKLLMAKINPPELGGFFYLTDHMGRMFIRPIIYFRKNNFLQIEF
jgi:hypothetical protein